MTLLKWNKEFAMEQAADDQELLQELIDIFKTSFADDLELIRSGVVAGNVKQVTGAAHSIKGASSSLGIEGVTEVAKIIEDEGKTGKLDLTGKLIGKLEKMLQEVEGL
ncbi:Hpt domain-containing protein [Desulfopila aestuarii]|uniref:HPt (Histidine-containing phosphotransfer) domain-containing protein n=1 Tax=Desulfopila aestuarii DSM 18488 TaxID=1121416 RepID=A0A1M7Y186_9BACT|nr:Hpt domain-containing protein [Desulfopila aestuarii]SHO45498.1 HPt (histidine-containing phosphotransfer) domain-containing protein [Desulfopila aestuarii DSM 18488]